MLHTIDLRGRSHSTSDLLALVPRAAVDVGVASERAAELIDEVRRGGEEALLAQSERFDGVRPTALRVTAGEIAGAVESLEPAVRNALQETIRRVRLASEAQVPPATVTELAPGARIRQRWQPMGRVGLYVPGGKAVYPSSVVMNVVPAQVAGVGSIALVSPPQREHGGRVHPTVLGAAGLLGVDEVYAMGGAGAIGALAYGVPGIGLAPVQLVTGPGNVFVAAAKRLVRGRTGIDSEAGPTDILVIADDSADARWVAADLISQAEHDELAAAVLVTDAPAFAEAVLVEVERQASATTHRERVAVALGGEQSAIVIVDDLEQAAAFSDAFGPEHLEIQTRDNESVLARIENAGAIFLGAYSPVSLGDYAAGSNHVLPTGGQARFSAGLNAASFLRSQQVIEYDREALSGVADAIAALSAAEVLPAHGDAVRARFS